MKKILVFQHIKREHPSNIAEYARERGIGLDVVPLWEDAPIPELSAYDALVVLGGCMGAYEEYTGKEQELVALKRAVGTMPILGICLGAQLLAQTLGARVYPYIQEGKHIKEVGYYPVTLTEEGKESPLFKGFPETFQVLQWHGDTFDMPEGALHLASSKLCPNQAFSKGNTYGVQFHVEATAEIVAEWVADDSEWTHKDFAMDDEKVAREAREYDALMKEQCYRLMDNLLA